MVIDDADLIHPLIRAHLKELKVEITSAMSGEDGLVLARKERPDLVLLDLNMPGMNGFEVLKRLKDDPNTYDIPVIFLTGDGESVNKVKGFDLGAVDYVTKPFDPPELKARVRSTLRTKALMDLLTTQAHLDGLTGLRNRRYFEQRLAQEVAAARRHNRNLGLLLLDVDHFKSVNDEHGHPKGDQVLSKVAELLSGSSRGSDVACRFGGEEFSIILPDSSSSVSYQCGQRMHGIIERDEELNSIIDRPITVSIGTASVVPDKGVNPLDLVTKADQALYRAKAEGRNRVISADSLA